MTQMKAVIFNVQRFTIHDGPGMRTEFFFKGCPLRCRWCSNPEGWNMDPEPGIYKGKCITYKKCASCEEDCPKKGALVFYRNKIKNIDTEICDKCLKCVDACPSEAIRAWGEEYTVEDCMRIIRRDKAYYDRSGGGVTVSGGDPLMQSAFVAELFKACKAEDYHTCFESAYSLDFSLVEKVMPYTDLFIGDIKHMDSSVHEEYTGIGNESILANLQKLAELDKEIIIRIPVIPTVNDGMENMEKTADFLLNQMGGKVRTLQLLSYMRLGIEKYQSLGMEYPMHKIRFNRNNFQKKIEKIAEYFNSRGINCLVGTREKQ